MDLEDRELAVLEERLYSNIHHSYEEAPKIPDATPAPSQPLRIVSRTSVINNSQETPNGGLMRYWARQRAPYPKNTPTSNLSADSKQPAPEKNAPESNKDGPSNGVQKMFLAPYQSLLGTMDNTVSEIQPSAPAVVIQKSTVPVRTTVPKGAPKEPGLQLKKKKQTKQNTQYVEKKLESLLKLINKDRKENAMQTFDSKKAKANKVRQRKRQQVVVAEITLNSSDEDSQPTKNDESTALPVSDGEGDEVIIIPTPPPPKICIDCSDEEDAPNIQFVHPPLKGKIRKIKGQGVVANSSRCGSPSNSSIMSDDFIGQHDRSRLNDSFTESIPSDDELECSKEGKSGKAMKDATEVRQGRVPSISSEDTVCTSGDTTDHEKHLPGITPSKSHPQLNKDNAATKKTPSKQKSLKMATSTPTVVGAAMSPSSVDKRNTNSKTNSGAISNDNSPKTSKTPGTAKARSKSPVTLAMDIVRKQFEMAQSVEGSGKKAKAKKDAASLKVTRSMSKSITQAIAASGTTSDKSTERLKSGTASKSTTGTKKSKTKKIPHIEDNVSSESDLDISSKTYLSNTSQELEKTSRRSAASFFEQIDDVSSESDYDDSFLQLKKMAGKQQTEEKEPKKRIGRKRKQYNSETYSDEDFACALTDIVRAVSDTTEEEDDDTEIGGIENQESNAKTAAASPLVEQPTSSSKQERNSKKKRKVKHVPPESDVVVGPVQPANKTDSQQQPQPEVVVKKKKKSKDPKSSANAHESINSSFSEIQMDLSEKAHCPTGTVEQTRAIEKRGSTPNAPTVAPQPLQQSISEPYDEDVQMYGDIQRHVVPGTSGESSKNTKTIGPECAWNEEMKQFYNSSYDGENLNLSMLLRRMPYDSRHWAILHKDRYPNPPKKEIICNKCGDRGHMHFKCRNAPKPQVCFMCGEKGHSEPRCPKTICLNCGSKTRSFVRGCKSCARDTDITCFSCGTRGHTQRSCPDLWRRYHSTVEDNVPLQADAQKNPNARWCSICGRPGHQAYICNDARRIFGYAIPNTTVSSYMPAYRGEYNRFNKHRNDAQERRLATDPTARYNLFSTDANNCEFNLPELAHNENGFYYGFLKTTGMLEKYQRRVSNDLPQYLMQQPQALMELIAEAPPLESSSPELSLSHMDRTIQPEQQSTEQTACVTEPCNPEPTISGAGEVPVVEENSNYSFSEFHADEMQLHGVQENVDMMPPPSDNFVPTECNTSDQQTLSDFIPLTTSSVETFLPVPLPEPQIPPALSAPTPAAATSSAEVPSADLAINNAPNAMVIPPQKGDKVDDNAKVLLTSDRAQFLLSAEGTEFLKDSGKKYSVQLSICFETVGNVLRITGTPEAQEKFHDELVRFLTETEAYLKNEKYLQVTGPKLSNKMTRYIALHLRGLVHDTSTTMGELLRKFRNTQSSDAKEKLRRRLNVQLFGVFGLRDGRKHLNKLRNQFALCMKANPWKSVLPQERRNMIDESLRYIFSAYDHTHYAEFVKEYEELKQANKLKKLTYDDLGIPAIIKRPKTLQDELHKQKVSERKKTKLKEKIAEQLAEGPSPADKQYANFIKRATKHRSIDPKRLSKLDNATRNVKKTQGSENSTSSQGSRRSNRQARKREQPSPHRDSWLWLNQSEAGRDQGQSSSSSSRSRLADKAIMLREQELSQLKLLQDMLR